MSGQPSNFRDSWDFDDGADFNGASAGAGDFRGDADGFVEVLGIHQEIAAELLAGLGKRSVGDESLAVAHTDAGGRRRGMERVGRQKLPASRQILAKLGGFGV